MQTREKSIGKTYNLSISILHTLPPHTTSVRFASLKSKWILIKGIFTEGPTELRQWSHFVWGILFRLREKQWRISFFFDDLRYASNISEPNGWNNDMSLYPSTASFSPERVTLSEGRKKWISQGGIVGCHTCVGVMAQCILPILNETTKATLWFQHAASLFHFHI